MPFDIPEPQKKIIELLIEEEKSLTELSESLEMSKTGALKHLEKLMDAEMVKKEIVTTDEGRKSVYSLQRSTYFISIDPVTSSIIELNTHSSFDPKFLLAEQIPQENIRKEVKTLLTSLEDPPFTVLYGSAAKGEATWKSDIDILFLLEEATDDRLRDLKEELSEVNMQIEHQIKPIFRTFSEFEKESDLIEEIKEEGMIIYGDIFAREKIWQKMKRYRNITV